MYIDLYYLFFGIVGMCLGSGLAITLYAYKTITLQKCSCLVRLRSVSSELSALLSPTSGFGLCPCTVNFGKNLLNQFRENPYLPIYDHSGYLTKLLIPHHPQVMSDNLGLTSVSILLGHFATISLHSQ